MRKICIILLSCLFLSILIGCSKQKQTPGKERDTEYALNVAENANPFDLDAIGEGGAKVEASYGYKVTNMDDSKRVIDFTGNEVTMKFQYMSATTDFEVGLFFFIDGIAQKYRINGEEKDNFVWQTQLNSKEDTETTVSFVPVFGSEEERHNVFIASMYKPFFIPENDGFNNGNAGHILPMLPWSITCKEGGVETKISKEYQQIALPEEIKKQYIFTNRNGETFNLLENQMHYRFQKDKEEILNNIQIQDGRVSCEACFYGGPEYTYRVSAFLNNELVDAFEGAPYVDIEIKKGEMSCVNLDIDTNTLKLQDTNSFFLFIVPIGPKEEEEYFMIDKTETIFAVRK